MVHWLTGWAQFQGCYYFEQLMLCFISNESRGYFVQCWSSKV